MLYKFCPKIPKIPDHLINLTEEEIRNIPNKFDGVKATKYTLHNVTKEIEDYLRPHFNSDVNIAFQLITDDLPVHKDYGRTSCYNYIIESGGDVSTVWYDNNIKEIDRIKFPTHVWHNINVETFHNVVGINNTRIAISVWYKDEDATGEIKV